jgi:hypothetical protein
MKKTGIWIGFIFAVVIGGIVLTVIGIPGYVAGPAAAGLIIAFFAIRANNRKVASVPAGDRDRLLAEGPPANYGLVYVHRPSGVGGLAVGFTVSLDSVDVAFLRLSRFTRVVVAPGGHQMRVGLKKQNVGTVANTQGCETSFTLSAGETAVFGMKYGGAR